MKINGIEMKEACDEAFEKHYEETYGQLEFEKLNGIEKANKKALFDEGFSACLSILFEKEMRINE